MAAASNNQRAVRAAGYTGKLRGCARGQRDPVWTGSDVEGKLVPRETVAAAQREVPRRDLLGDCEAARGLQSPKRREGRWCWASETAARQPHDGVPRALGRRADACAMLIDRRKKLHEATVLVASRG